MTNIKNKWPFASFIGNAGYLLVALAAGTAAPSRVFGLGLRIPNQDPEAIARGNAFAATADNPSAIYYNPAGISQLEGQNIQVGVLNYLGINTHYEPAGGHASDSDFQVIPVPELYYTFAPTNLPLSFGLGVYAPFGLGVQWPQNTGFRSIAIESRLQFVTLNPVIAWKIYPSLSVAVGPTFNYSDLLIRRGLTSPSDVFNFEGTDFNYGFNAGILWQPLQHWSLGANYRSATIMNYSGKTTYNPGGSSSSADTIARVPYPQIASAGISYRPTENWNIEADVDWTGWNTLDTVVLKGTRAIFGTDLPLQLNWHNSWLYELGVTRYFDEGWFVSAGYFYSGNTAPTKYFTPAIPDTDLHVGSLGFGHKGKIWKWSVAGQIIAGGARDISDSQPNPFTGETANGKYRLFVPTLSMSLGYCF